MNQTLGARSAASASRSPSFAVIGEPVLAVVAVHPDGSRLRLRVERRDDGSLLFRSQAMDSGGKAGPWTTRAVPEQRREATLNRIRTLWTQSGYGDPRPETA